MISSLASSRTKMSKVQTWVWEKLQPQAQEQSHEVSQSGNILNHCFLAWNEVEMSVLLKITPQYLAFVHNISGYVWSKLKANVYSFSTKWGCVGCSKLHLKSFISQHFFWMLFFWLKLQFFPSFILIGPFHFFHVWFTQRKTS